MVKVIHRQHVSTEKKIKKQRNGTQKICSVWTKILYWSRSLLTLCASSARLDKLCMRREIHEAFWHSCSLRTTLISFSAWGCVDTHCRGSKMISVAFLFKTSGLKDKVREKTWVNNTIHNRLLVQMYVFCDTYMHKSLQ